MAWVTAIVATEQVDYRLSEHAGCYVQVGEETPAAAAPDAAVDYRMRQETDAALVWMGSGLPEVGLVPGEALDEEGKRAARLLMNGCNPATGARLVRSEARAHPDATLPAARLLEVIEAAARGRGVDPAALLEGKPKQQRQLAAAQRMVQRRGEAYRLQVDTLHRLARATGVRLEDAYGETELARAREHQEQRVDVRVRGWDLVADLPKSVSVVQALIDPQQERELRTLVHQAKREAFAELEGWIGYGVGSQDGERVRLATGGLMGWSVEHQAARPVDNTPGDPHLHVHIVMANMALCEDGRWRSIANSGQDLHRHARAFDGLFKARVRALLGERFGMRFEQDARTGAWEVVGVPEQLRAAFSRRAAEVDAKAGADADRADKARISQATRHAKHEAAGTQLRAAWRQRAEDLVDVDAMLAAAAPGPDGPNGGAGIDGPGGGPRIPPPDQLAAVVFDPEHGLTAHEKDFSRAQLLAAVAHALPGGIDAAGGRLDELANAVLAVPGHAVPLPARGSAVMSSTARYTTVDILTAEQAIVEAARARYGQGAARLTEDAALAALDVHEVTAGYELSAQQRATVLRLLSAGHGVDAVVGVAGAGKTTLMTACRIGWDAAGLTYAGACLAAVAAAGLEAESGIPSRTIASWLKRIEDGPGLAGVDVLVLDEAAMTDDRALARLLTHAAATGTKVIAIGDPQQLQAIGPGGGFAEVHRLVDGELLTENRRQRDAGEQAALEVWRTGDREAALRMLAAGGRVHAVDAADDARAEILTAWTAARTAWTDPHDVLEHLVVLAARNTDVDALNAGARALRRAAGELGPDHVYAQPGGDRLVLAEGDLVRVRQNDYRARRGAGPDVLNGYRAVVEEIDAEHRVRITWRTRDPSGQASAWLSPEQLAGGAVSLGYAMTVAASQGMTASTSLVYGYGADANALYPAITRGREANHLWLPLAALEDEQTRATHGEPRTETERLDRAVTAYAELLNQTRPEGMVSDQLRPAPEPVTPAPGHERRAAAANATSVRPPAPSPEPAAAGDPGEQPVPHWRERPHGAVPDRRLVSAAAEADAHALQAERLAQVADEQAAALAELLGTPQAPAHRRHDELVVLVDEIEQHVRAAEQCDTQLAEHRQALEVYRARLGPIERRLESSRSWLLRERGDLREAREWLLTQTRQRTADSARLVDEARDHRHQAQRLTTALPDTLRPQPPATLDSRQLADVRARLPELLAVAELGDRQRVVDLERQAGQHREQAAGHRRRAASLRGEAAVRQDLSAHEPARHAAEHQQRAAAAQQAAHQRAEALRQQEATRRRQTPSHSRSGPSLGL